MQKNLESNAVVQKVPVEALTDFRDHVFKIPDDTNEQIVSLSESIKKQGILTPLIVREIDNEKYEIISGHRRKRACMLADIKEIPVMIMKYPDKEAARLAVIDANLQRKDLLPSEKAKAYSERYALIKHQGRRKVIREDGLKNISSSSLEEIAKSTGESAKTVQRYIYLARLTDELLDMVDTRKISFVSGLSLASLSSKQQRTIYKYLNSFLESKKANRINPKYIRRLIKMSKLKELNSKKAEEILSKDLSKSTTVVKKGYKEFRKYFADDVTDKEIEEKILKLLDMHSDELQDTMARSETAK